VPLGDVTTRSRLFFSGAVEPEAASGSVQTRVTFSDTVVLLTVMVLLEL